LSWNKHPTKWSSNKPKIRKKKMYQQNYNFGSEEPTAFITVRKQRQKQNGKNVYLHDRTEFEIELHNPTNDSILAKINLNGKRISSSGVVLKPGQRIFLERYLDEDRKFLFETYEVSDSKTNQKAIENNGLVTVEFFSKMLFTNFGHLGGYTYLSNQPLLYNSGTVNGSPNVFTTTTLGNSNIVGTTNTSDVKIETGRVEKGGESNQEFGTSYEMLSIGTKLYTMVTYRETLDNFLKKNENKLIYIQTDSLRSNGLRAIVID